jgi:hypothetical protein
MTDFASLEDYIAPDGSWNPPVRETRSVDAKTTQFPCSACGGTGKYRGVRMHQPRSDCFACGGKGYFLTSERDRQKARTQRVDRKAKALTDARAAFESQYPDVAPSLAAAAAWSSFAADLLGKLNHYGSLSERQVAAARSMTAKAAERRAEKVAERTSGNATVDLSPIRAMFETAVGNGYKRPAYRAAGLVITRAPNYGKNPGALYVKTEADEYLGKIIGTDYLGKPASALTAIAADPRVEAIRHGQRTGNCSCCGRTLTAEGSIEAGIGPICASKWGL